MKARTATLFAALPAFLAALPPVSATAFALTAQQDSAVVNLRSRRLVLTRTSTDSFASALRARRVGALHGLAAFRRTPSDSTRTFLARRGLTVLAPVQGSVYLARVTSAFDPADSVARQSLVGFALLQPVDKVRPEIWRREYGDFTVTVGDQPANHVLNPDGTLKLLISFHETVSPAEIRAALEEHTRRFVRREDRLWQVVTTHAGVLGLAAEDAVLYVDAAPPPFMPDNDRTRAAINADAVQQWDVANGRANGLGGAGVQVGLFDKGFDDEHEDFGALVAGTTSGSRVIVKAPERDWHGTVVAGVLGGNGRRSDGKDGWMTANGGSAYEWRGVAPESELIEAVGVTVDGSLEFSSDAILGYIQNQGMDVSNHSYGVEINGYYSDRSATRDRIIRGDQFVGAARVPPRLQVYSAGNRQPGIGYFSLNKELKNGLLVGNWDLATNQIERQSSLGPTYDGRIKPDVVAPGTDVQTPGYIESTPLPCTPSVTATGTYPRRQFYCVTLGTSVSAPAVTGLLALALQQYAATYATATAPPLPSTLRGLAVHSAKDLAGPPLADPVPTPDPTIQALPGPDFVTGFGLVDAEEAVRLVQKRRIIEGEIPATCERVTYEFKVVTPAGATEPDPVKVTVAWDDPASTMLTSRETPRLVNDLDLVLIDPAGTRHYPWLLDQEIRDRTTGTALSPDQQMCGTEVDVVTRFKPFDPQVPTAVVVPAGRGRDHLNNVEQVVAAGVAGTWKAEVSGFKLRQGTQRFSLIGVPTTLYHLTDAKTLCQRRPEVCGGILVDLCRVYPRLCEWPRLLPLGPRTVGLTFQHRDDRVVLPLRELCAYLRKDGCGEPGRTYQIAFGPSRPTLGVELRSPLGRAAGRISPRRAYRATLPPGDDQTLVVLSPLRGVPIGTAIELPVTVRPR